MVLISLALVIFLVTFTQSDHLTGQRFCPKIYYERATRQRYYYNTCYRFGYRQTCRYTGTYYVTERKINWINCCTGYAGPNCEPVCNDTQTIQVTKWQRYYTTCHSWWFRRWSCVQFRVVNDTKEVCCDDPSVNPGCTVTMTTLPVTTQTVTTTTMPTTQTTETRTTSADTTTQTQDTAATTTTETIP